MKQHTSTYSTCIGVCECNASPTISPFSFTTAAPVSSQLVSMPRTNSPFVFGLVHNVDFRVVGSTLWRVKKLRLIQSHGCLTDATERLNWKYVKQNLRGRHRRILISTVITVDARKDYDSETTILFLLLTSCCEHFKNKQPSNIKFDIEFHSFSVRPLKCWAQFSGVGPRCWAPMCSAVGTLCGVGSP